MNDDQYVPTKCYGRREHTDFVAWGDEGFDVRRVVAGEIPTDPTTAYYGYCSRCSTAMRWDPDQQRLVDFPEGNRVPHCGHQDCRAALPPGAHYINVTLATATWMGFDFVPVREMPTPPPGFDDLVCGPLCLMHEVLDNWQLKDVFGR